MINPKRNFIKRPKTPAESLAQPKQRGLIISDEASYLLNLKQKWAYLTLGKVLSK